jgi:hypothetical protein
VAGGCGLDSLADFLVGFFLEVVFTQDGGVLLNVPLVAFDPISEGICVSLLKKVRCVRAKPEILSQGFIVLVHRDRLVIKNLPLL